MTTKKKKKTAKGIFDRHSDQKGAKLKTIKHESTGEEWLAYEKGNSPHFKDVKDWLKKVDEIGFENKNMFFFCEHCEGVFVNFKPTNNECSCGNTLPEGFKEINGLMREDLRQGKTFKELNQYSYLQ